MKESFINNEIQLLLAFNLQVFGPLFPSVPLNVYILRSKVQPRVNLIHFEFTLTAITWGKGFSLNTTSEQEHVVISWVKATSLEIAWVS